MKKILNIVLLIVFLSVIIFSLKNIVFFKNQNQEAVDAIVISSYSDLEVKLNTVSNRSLVLFDVDDVLITAADVFAKGNDIPIDLKIKLLFKYPSLIFKKNWEAVYSLLWDKAPRYLVDPNIPNIVSTLKEKNVPTIMLTSMESGSYGNIESFPKWRFNMLKDFGINLSGQFENQVFNTMPQHRGNYPLLYNGILCANQESKGRVLEELIKKNNLSPDKIFFIDDSQQNLKEVQKACKRMNIPCQLFHFKGVAKKTVNSDIAFSQIENLIINEKWLSDYYLSEDSILPKSYSHSLDEDMHKNIGSKPPYVAVFSTSKNRVIFVAVEHTNDFNSKTIELINSVVINFKPDLLIHEGVESSIGISNQNIVNYILNNCGKQNNWSCGESMFSASLSYQHGYPFLGGEPDDGVIIQSLMKSNYTLDDAIYFYFTRQIPQLYREGKVNNLREIQDRFDNFTKSIIKEYNPNYNNYKNWITRHLNNFDFLTLINSENTAPIQTGNYLQKISSQVGVIRDRHLLKTISEKSINYRNIVIVYGSSHLSTQYDILSRMYGPAKFLKNASEVNNYFLEVH